MTGKARALEPADESFLDQAFERAVALIEAGTNPLVEELLEGREHLRAEVEALLRTARRATLVATDARHRCPGSCCRPRSDVRARAARLSGDA